MAAMNKKKGAGFYIGAVALVLAVAGAAAAVFSSTISADYALANLPLVLLGIVCAIALAAVPKAVQLKGKAQLFVPFIAQGVSVFLLARIALDVLAARILLISGLFSWNSGNAVGWSVFRATVVAAALLLAAAVLLVVRAFAPDAKRA